MTVRTTLGRIAWCALLLAGCDTGSSIVGGSPEAGVDVVEATDVAAMDTPVDTPAAQCRNNTECAGQAGAPVCNIATGRCVACSAADDRCATGQRCDPATSACVAGCRSDDACVLTADAGAGDGGVLALRCNATTHACVGCVTDDHCTLGQRCVESQCVAGCDATRGCVAGQTCCNGGCVDIRTSAGNCGMCGAACDVNHGTPACLVGVCGVGACGDGFGDCDHAPANGCEVDTRSSLAHCGACDHACDSVTGATPTCAAGACGFTCDDGLADCDGTASNGCEADTRSSLTHCGSCGQACAAPANATPTCTAGACAFTCDAGFADCDGDASNGCEVDTRSSLDHCGTCTTVCPLPSNGAAACVAGACGVACGAGFGDCNAVSDDGCETDTTTSLAHCGGCGHACLATAHATASCSAGACASACVPGFADCDGNPANGCEATLATSVANCGACGNACAFAHAGATCSGGACGLAACATGFGDCNTSTTDGCETDLTSSPAHCGSCSAACSLAHATAACMTGACAVAACATGFGDCDSIPSTGCESTLATDAQNCGACGTRCASGSCVAGLCNPFPSTGGEGVFAPTTDIALSPGIHNFTTINIMAGVRITTTGTGSLDLRATGAVTIAGIVDVSGSVGGEQISVACVANRSGSQGGVTGNVSFHPTAGDALGVPANQPGAAGGGGTGSAGGAGLARASIAVGGLGSTGGGGGGAYNCTGGGGGGGGGYAGGGGGFGFQSNDCTCTATGGVGGAGGGTGGGVGGPTVGQGGRGGSSGNASYNATTGLTRTPVAAVTCSYQTAVGGGGGGGSIGAAAVADLAMATTFLPGSAGGGGGGDAGAGGGGGGGALRLSSPVSITVSATGRVSALGGRGGRVSCGGGPGGGGSGGAIYLASPVLTVAAGAIVSAAAGGGGGNDAVTVTQTAGTGGLGRIRLSAGTGTGTAGCTLAGTFTPALNSACTVSMTTVARVYIARYPN